MQRQRDLQLANLHGAHVDVAIIGGGINGAVSAAALSAAGVDIALVDGGDFSSATSQESSNLVWGGFKYLQSYEFGLVRKLCTSRNRLVQAYPTQVQPVEFLATFDDASPYPVWLAALGAHAYWAIGSFATARPRVLSASAIETLEPTIDTSAAKGGLIYSDAYLPDNDARFSFGFVQNALDQGAIVANYTKVTGVERADGCWKLTVTDALSGDERHFSATTVVNATGPWADETNRMLEATTRHRIAYSKGIHLVVPRIGSGQRVFAFFDEDERLYYVIPMGDRSVIGTTDNRVDDPRPAVTDDDRDFVLRQINARLDLDTPLTVDDVIAERCGVRPLVVEADNAHEQSDWLQLSRKHEIESDDERSVITIFGGKLTDCLNVGEEVVDAVNSLGIATSDLDPSWFGEPSTADQNAFLAAADRTGLLSAKTAETVWRRHGRRAQRVLDRVVGDPALAETVAGTTDLIAADVVEVGANEMIATVDDFVRRRTGLALTQPADEILAHADRLSELLGLARHTTT